MKLYIFNIDGTLTSADPELIKATGHFTYVDNPDGNDFEILSLTIPEYLINQGSVRK